MKKTLKGFLLAMCLFLTVHTNSQTFNLVWSDEFNGTGAPDPAKWGYELGYIRNNELQYYTNSTNNVRQNAGNLEITILKEKVEGDNYGKPQTFNYTSGSVITLGKASWTYGRIEGRFKMPKGKGMWACFWTLGANYEQVWWPKCGEIDIFEHINTEPQIHSTLHWQDASGNYKNSGGTGVPNTYQLDVTQWHTYAIEWTPDSMKWLIDSKLYFWYNIKDGINGTQAFHKPHYILINQPIGGSWPGPPDGTTVLPATMYCDYIRVYSYSAGPSVAVTSVAVNPTTASVSSSTQLTATVAPTNATNKAVSWSSSNTGVATVNSSGLVTGVAPGSATITVTTQDGEKTATSAITVTAVSSNLALNKPVTVSTADGFFLGPLAVDGKPTTRWGSAYADPQWIYVDLGAICDINRVKISWETACGKNYLIQLSTDATNWTTIETISGNTALTVDYTGLTGTGRYVRMYGTSRATVYGYSIYELEVYGSLKTGLSALSTVDVKVYPSPVVNILTIENAGILGKIEICSLSGQVMLKSIHSGNKANVDLSGLSSGLYVLKVYQQNKVANTFKIIKK